MGLVNVWSMSSLLLFESYHSKLTPKGLVGHFDVEALGEVLECRKLVFSYGS